MMRNMRNNAYSQFDPAMTRASNYDPSIGRRYSNATGDTSGGATGQSGAAVIQAASGQKMQTNVAINNAAALNLKVELWNWLTSFTKILNPNYAQGAYAAIPLLTFEGIGRGAGTTGTTGTVGFSDNGNLEMHGNDVTPDPKLTIGCQEVAYSSFFQASSISPFQVAYFRMTVKTDAQIDNIITWFQKTFSGGYMQNPISPRAYFKPTQFQDLTLDVTVNFTIGLDSGIFLVANTLENVRLSLFIEMWTVQGIGGAA